MKNIKTILLMVAILFAAVLIYFGIISKGDKNQQTLRPSETRQDVVSLPVRINDEGGVSIEATPIASDGQIKFQIAFNTHEGDLDFDLTKQALLFDDKGNQYQPIEWQGSRGGHHLAGILVFPKIASGAEQMTLKIMDIYGVKERIFEWNLSNLK